jgi:hypothetical protein
MYWIRARPLPGQHEVIGMNTETVQTGTMKTGTKLAVLALVMAVGTAMRWFHLAREVALPEDRTAFVVVFLAAAALGVAALFKGAGWGGRAAALVAIVIGSFLPLTISVSHQEVASHGIEVGATMPHFAALDDKEELFDSDDLLGKPVLIKFFRAHW